MDQHENATAKPARESVFRMSDDPNDETTMMHTQRCSVTTPLKNTATSREFTAKAHVTLDKEPLGQFNVKLDPRAMTMTRITQKGTNNFGDEELTYDT